MLNVIASMHLLPQNHGKNVRLEALGKSTLANFNDLPKLAAIEQLAQVIREEYSSCDEEDTPINLFTENIVFSGNNYTVFPGTKESGTNILNSLFASIFSSEGSCSLPDQFSSAVFSASSLMLYIINQSALKCGYSRNYSEEIISKEICIPTQDSLMQFMHTVVFDKNTINEYCKRNSIPETTIDSFSITPTDFKSFSNNSTVLTERPLVRVANTYIFLQITSSVDCLIQFIWNQAKLNNCFEILLNLYHSHSWQNMHRLFDKMQWINIDVTIPSQQILPFKEAFYQFDLNKCAYVCYLQSGSPECSKEEGSQSSETEANDIDQRNNEIFNILSQVVGLEERNFLSMYILSEVGYEQSFSIKSSLEKSTILYLRATELKHIVSLEQSDPLLLWKFAKSHREVAIECELKSLGGMLDVFACYKDNNCSLWPVGKMRPELIAFMPGYSHRYIKASVLKRDEHLASFVYGDQLASVLVYNYCSYAPFYAIVDDPIPTTLLLENFQRPIWILNDQIETQHPAFISSHLEMLAFHMQKFQPYLKDYIADGNSPYPLTIKVVFDDRYKMEMRPGDVPIVPLTEINIPTKVITEGISLFITIELAHWYAQPDNGGERLLISALLNAIALIYPDLKKDSELATIVDKIIPKSPSKYITILGNANNIQLETRYLPAFRPIQLYDVSHIKENLSRSYGILVDQKDLLTKEGKKALCNQIAESLYKTLLEKLLFFDQEELLLFLIGLNEACVQKRAIRTLDLPAKMAAFSNIRTEIVSLFHEEQERAKTALAVRCLIEMISANDSHNGDVQPNIDEIDELIALMYEMIEWAWLSDGIQMGLQDPWIELLSCGRIQVDYSSLNFNLIPFAMSKSDIEVNLYVNEYENIFSEPDVDLSLYSSPEVEKFDKAFVSSWGIGLFRLQDFIIELSNFTRQHNGSVVGIDKTILLEKLKQTKFNWRDEEMEAALDILTLETGWRIGKAPVGMKNTDTYPWYYNRTLSFLRRPIAKLTRHNEIAYYWSYRHLFASFDNLLSLLFSGRLQVAEGTELSGLIQEIRTKKGKEFRNAVAAWLADTGFLEVIPYEVPIKPGANLNADKDLGDIDILVVDRAHSIIYSVECKNTVDSRTVHEVKTELDKYLGRGGNPGMIQKHVERDKWLKENMAALSFYVLSPEFFTMKSIIVTSEETPLAYIKKDELPLPLVSFPKLKNVGITALKAL